MRKGTKKQFCIHGHDIVVVGRDKNRACKGCKKDYQIAHKKGPRPKKIICKYGHDTSICGRTKNGTGNCLDCIKERALKNKRPRKKYGHKKQFCPKKHDTFVVGRNKSGGCNQCVKEIVRPKKLRVKRQFCKKGHDLSIVGKTKSNNCKICKKEYDKKYHEEHKQEDKKRREQNKERAKEIRRKWEEKNRDKRVVYDLKKREKRHLRIPNFGQDGIKEFCNNKPLNMTIDHYLPLCGNKISGLHVVWNLQYLSRPDNDKKKHKCDLKEASNWYGKLLEQAGLK